MATIAVPSRAVPGLHTPGVGWEQPLDMLRACHERVQRMLGLLDKLQAHVRDRGPDAAAAQAAVDVMRYFDQAAPLHHLDEEEQVFPLALAKGDAVVQAAVQHLQQEHAAMESAWQALRAGLLPLATSAPLSAGWAQTWSETAPVLAFIRLYQAHIALEETVVYPCVEGLLTPALSEAMGRVMAARRGIR